MPKEIKSADLDNRSKEVSIANQYDELATKAAEKTLKTQERLTKIEDDYNNLSIKVTAQEEIMRQQAIIIKEQSSRLDIQEKKIREQEEEITLLKCELNNAQIYNTALIQQMREQSIIPLEMDTVVSEDCQKTKKRKTKKEASE